jgi:hypothetical protein
MKLEFCRQIFKKYGNIEFYENLFSGSLVVARGQTDERTDVTIIIVAFRNFANAPQKIFISPSSVLRLCISYGSHNKERLLY